jgi:hypothetical protein
MAEKRLEHLTHDAWARPKCSVCAAARKGEIDIPRVEAILASGGRLKPVAAQFNLNPYALRRHWQAVSPARKNYLKFGSRLSQEALQARVADERLAAIDHLVLVRNGLHKSFALAFQAGDYNAVANIGRAISDTVERAARMTGEWKDHQPASVTNNIQVLNLPAIAGVVSGIARALSGFPEARLRVIEYLRTTDEVAALPPPEPDVFDAAASE